MNKLENAIRENQKRYHVNTHVMTASEKEALKKKKANRKRGSMLMAFAMGTNSDEVTEIKRYIGVGSFKIAGVCPTKAELETIYGRPQEKDPVYLSEVEIEVEGGNKVKVPQARIDFLLKLDETKHVDPATGNPMKLTARKSYYITKAYRYNRERTKLQVIDEYGRTAWVTEDQLAAHEIPTYKNGPANISANYRAAFIGEENLTNFLKAFLGIGNVMRYIKEENKWVMKDDPSKYEARLENLEACFTGNFDEIKRAIALQANNNVKMLVGVKTADGKMYADLYDMALSQATTDYSKLEEDLNNRKSNGAYPSTEFVVCELREYNVKASDLSTPASTANPFTDPFAN